MWDMGTERINTKHGSRGWIILEESIDKSYKCKNSGI